MGVRLTSTPAIKNAPEAGLAEGNGTFSNLHLTILVFVFPWFVKRMLPLVNRGGFYTYWFLFLICGIPVTIAYWTIMSIYGPRKNEKVVLPGKPIEEYIEIKDLELKQHYGGGNKIPMQVFHDAYFDGKVDFKGAVFSFLLLSYSIDFILEGDVLEIMEYRLDWARFNFTPELFKYVLTRLIPDVIFHTQSQDEDQVRDHYDRTFIASVCVIQSNDLFLGGDSFYEAFLGPRMIYTSGIVLDLDREETLEELQDNKLTVVCEKLNLQPEDKLLDIGCGWGTLCAFAAKNYGCDVTGITLAKKQTEFGNNRIAANGCDPQRARVICTDYRDIPYTKGQFTKIVSLEMAEVNLVIA